MLFVILVASSEPNLIHRILAVKSFLLVDTGETAKRRNIYKSSCKLIWNLYQLVVYEDMLSKVCSVIPVEWDPQSSLEACGLVAKFNDVRSKELPSILQDVDWVKESADDVLRKIHGVI